MQNAETECQQACGRGEALQRELQVTSLSNDLLLHTFSITLAARLAWGLEYSQGVVTLCGLEEHVCPTLPVDLLNTQLVF